MNLWDVFAGVMGWRAKLIEARSKNGLTQEMLAGQLDLSQQAVHKWENGKSNPSLGLLLQAATILDMSLDWLFDDARSEPYETEREFRHLVERVGIEKAADRIVAADVPVKIGSVRTLNADAVLNSAKPKRDQKRPDVKKAPGRVK